MIKLEQKDTSINVAHSRFRTAPFFNAAQDIEVFIGGAGGISSWLNLFLSRIVKVINIADFDTFERINLAGQLVSKEDIGKAKVTTAYEIAKKYGSAHIYAHNEIVDKDSDVPENFVFSGFDNMAARKDLFSLWQKNENRELFVDGRLLADQYECYFVQKGQEEAYEATLFDDDEVPTVSCTFKQTSHFAAICAARMTHGFTNYLSKHMLYKLPFYIGEEGSSFLFETNYLKDDTH